MSDLMQKVLVGVVRVLLIPITTWLMQHNIITSDETVKLAAEVATWIVAIGWTVRAYIRSHRKTLTGLAMPQGSTLADLNAQMKTGDTASALTPPTIPPTITEKR